MPTLIVLEGQDGVGKTKTATLLASKLSEKGPTLLAREPGFTPVGEKIRDEFLLNHVKLTDLSLFYLFQVARVEMLQTFLDCHMDKKFIVLDRFWPSTLAYQVRGSGVPGHLFDAAQREVDKIVATIGDELDICLTVPEGVRAARMAASGKGGERLESRPADFQDRVTRAYVEMVDRRLLHAVDANRPIDEVVDDIFSMAVL